MTQEVVEESEFKRKNDLIQELLERAGYGFIEGLSRQEREQLDEERQMLVMRVGWNKMSVKQLEELLRAG